ncbi:hypothetical protein PFAG_01538 [Plasmodium falciparum Santa Lucia]|uniref:Uncharacterized protein n=4 Tax=Plasmodium falciparum TaxID=5833 RepID=A0A024VSY7_PLAFA|nr:hypothetical protein PFFVO_01572 [Plasmodium falciparum Vietnam Oak-Knoll (FVO)]ETW31592.1 hypothetical protein PFFCH_00976 [Plasmodium falciparum FCH/4]ETW44090.1 hypothetical protein PFNF135_01690 [Plasmodium falciparum NF135/5.C10]EUT89385.1 hypothetical protein PFAG_01538 [Plasmodium falciparum Santa Lucia]
MRKRAVKRFLFLFIVYGIFFSSRPILMINTIVDVSLIGDDLFDNIFKPDIPYMGNHLTFNENNKSNKRKKRNNDVMIDDIFLLTTMLSQILPSSFSIYPLNLTNETLTTNNNDFNNFLDLINIYDADINQTITNHLNKIQPIKGCEDDIKNNNCDKDVLTCITLKKNKLSESCKKSLSNSLLYSCIDDILTYCKDYSKFSKVHKCLKTNFYHLKDQCLNILSYYEDIMQKLHKMKSIPYDKQEHLFLEKGEKIKNNAQNENIKNSSNNNNNVYNLKSETPINNNNNNNNNNNKYNILNHSNEQKIPTMAENLRKTYGHYIFPTMDFNYLFDFNSFNFTNKYTLYVFEILFISLLLYILIIYIKKFYMQDTPNFTTNNPKTKLAQL